MPSAEAQRTLVKSPPELWAELSDPASLARHLGDFGEIRIARVEPEQSVEWEADAVSGTVQLKPSGWGTKVTLTVLRETPDRLEIGQQTAEPEPEPELTPMPAPEPDPTPARRPRLFARIFRRRHKEPPAPTPALDPEPEAEAEAEQRPDLVAELAAELERVEAAMADQDSERLSAVLDRLGAAHHRPFSRG
jgi:hypothetical protein